MFKDVPFKKFDMLDLVGRKLDIRSFKEGSTELIGAKDMETGELFILEEINHPHCVDSNT
jgi:hypothetical protein